MASERNGWRSATSEAPAVRWTLITIAVLFMLLVLVLPLANVFVEAFSKGLPAYFRALSDRFTRSTSLA